MHRFLLSFTLALAVSCSFINAQLAAKPHTLLISTGDSTLYIDGAQGRLAVKAFVPENINDRKMPVVIFSHGFASNMDFHIWHGVIKGLNAAGIAAVTFDFNGHGRSEGAFEDMTVPSEIEDLKAVVAFVRSHTNVGDISLVGHSQGGVVTSMASGELGSGAVAAQVLLAPAAVLREDALRGNVMGARFDPWHFDMPYIELPWGLRLGKNYIDTAKSLPVFEIAGKYTGPTLIVHGIADTIVPYTYGKLYDRILPDSELVLVENEDHGFGVMPQKTIDSVTTWLVNKLKDSTKSDI